MIDVLQAWWASPELPLLPVLAWLGTYLIHSTVLIGGVWALARIPGINHPTRDALWKVALVGAPLTATLQVWLGPGLGRLALGAATGVATGGPASMPASGTFAIGSGWIVLLAAVWGIGAGWAMVRLLTAATRLRRLLRDRRDVLEDPLLEGFLALCERAEVRRRVRLSCSDRIRSPMALWRREICVPQRALDRLDPTQQRAMLAHELAHVVRGDSAWLAVAALVESVFFFQPLNRVARRGMHETAEVLCDDWAVRHIGDPRPLATCLAEVATWARGIQLPQLTATMAGRQAVVLKRVQRLLDRDTVRPGTDRPAWRIGMVLGLVLLMAGVAPTVVVARASDTPTPSPVATAPSPGPVTPEFVLPPVPPLAPLPVGPRARQRVRIETGEVVVEIERTPSRVAPARPVVVRPPPEPPRPPTPRVLDVEIRRGDGSTSWSFPLEIHATLDSLLPKPLEIPADEDVAELVGKARAIHSGSEPTGLIPANALSRGRPAGLQLRPSLALTGADPGEVKRPCSRRRAQPDALAELEPLPELDPLPVPFKL